MNVTSERLYSGTATRQFEPLSVLEGRRPAEISLDGRICKKLMRIKKTQNFDIDQCAIISLSLEYL
jgi:hypothetical protein